MSIRLTKLVTFCVYLVIFFFSGFGYFLVAKRLTSPSNPVEYAQNLLGKQPCIKQALFPPSDDTRTVLIGLIQAEKIKISLAIFMFSEPEIARALLEAHARGVVIEIVADRSCAQTQWSKLQPLAQAGIPIFIWPPALEATRAIMHNKFIIFACTLNNRSLLWTGSYNFTKAASTINQENALIVEDEELILTYQQQFERLKAEAELVGAAKLPEPIKRRKKTSSNRGELAFAHA